MMRERGVLVREAGPGEVPLVVEMSAALFREDAGTRNPTMNLNWPLEEGNEYFVGFVTGGRKVCLLAEVGGRVVGYLAGYVEESPLLVCRRAVLESMYVREEHRSRGIGGRLVEEFIGWAGEQEAGKVSVTAYVENARAVCFYERHGFRPKSLTLERGEVAHG